MSILVSLEQHPMIIQLLSTSSGQGQGDLPPEKLIKSEITYGKM